MPPQASPRLSIWEEWPANFLLSIQYQGTLGTVVHLLLFVIFPFYLWKMLTRPPLPKLVRLQENGSDLTA